MIEISIDPFIGARHLSHWTDDPHTIPTNGTAGSSRACGSRHRHLFLSALETRWKIRRYTGAVEDTNEVVDRPSSDEHGDENA
jgi:hypothetical protein